MTRTKMYGKELTLDLYHCDASTFNRKSLKAYFKELCRVIDMEPCKLTFWDDKWTWLRKLIFFWDKTVQVAMEPHTCGTSAVQFILTSNVTIHTLDLLKECYVNIFSCKNFDIEEALVFSVKWFRASEYDETVTTRGKRSKAR